MSGHCEACGETVCVCAVAQSRLNEGLERCPFCGFTPDPSDCDCIYPVGRSKTVWQLVCYETGGGCGASVLGDSVENCKERWNKRSNEI